MKKKLLVPLNIQFFAEGDGADTSDEPSAGGGESSGSETGGDTNGGTAEGEEKTFTQAQVTAMMAREKKQGKNSVIKELGFKSEKEAKDAIRLLNVLLDSQKTPEEKAKDQAGKANDEKEEAERRATAAENKLACLMAGVNNDSVDDVLAIALLKVTEEKSLENVLEDMKKEKKYSSFFGEGSGSTSGTGSTPGHSRGNGGSGDSVGDYGKRLAQSSIAANATNKKSSFFTEG